MDAEALEIMETVCRDCGHVCSRETMRRFCPAWLVALRDAAEEISNTPAGEGTGTSGGNEPGAAAAKP